MGAETRVTRRGRAVKEDPEKGCSLWQEPLVQRLGGSIELHVWGMSGGQREAGEGQSQKVRLTVLRSPRTLGPRP